MLDRHSFGFWSWIAKRAFRAVFEGVDPSAAAKDIHDTFREREVAAYIHVPFCTGTCLFCPYVRFPIQSREEISKYVEALKREIAIYGDILRDLGLKVIDVHMGGGTPSLLTGRQIRGILTCLAEYFDAEPKVAIEANPEDLADESRVFDLVDGGVAEVSLGVQSFNPKTLKSLGRRHSVEDSLKSIENLRRAGVEYINIDLMYMAPGQTYDEWIEDLRVAAEQDVDEITCYPTLITEFSIGYKLIRSGRLRQPDKQTFKRMVYAAEDLLSSSGFEPVEIYGYSRKRGWKYVTVNYEMEGPLIAFGCGGIGFTGGYEYQNVCSVPEYNSATLEGRLPIAGARYVDEIEGAIRYAVSRLFICRQLDLAEFNSKFRKDFGKLVGKTGFGKALKILKLLGYIKESGGKIELTRKGLFTAHKICWAFVLNVPCRMVEKFLREPWPEKVAIP